LPRKPSRVGRVVDILDEADPKALYIAAQRVWLNARLFYDNIKLWPNRVNEVAKWLNGSVRMEGIRYSYQKRSDAYLLFQTPSAIVAAYSLLLAAGFDYAKAAEILEKRLPGVYARGVGLVSILNTGRYMLDFAIDRSISVKGVKHKVLIGIDVLMDRILDERVAVALWRAVKTRISNRVVKTVRVTNDVDELLAEYLSKCPFTITLCLKAAYLVGMYIEGSLDESRPEYNAIKKAVEG